MFLVMGATGNIGSAVADALLARGEQVTVLTRHPEAAGAWLEKGAEVCEADAEDAQSLGRAFQRGDRAFLLNPPADPSGDTDASEQQTIANILKALDGSGLEKVVAASTYGAQPGDMLGDLSTLWEFEKGVQAQAIPAAINREAYYMTNWTGMSEAVRTSGTLTSLFPADTEMPMVAPADVGHAAAERLVSSINDVGIEYFEGPRRYTPRDVADAFAQALGREVKVEVAPPETWDQFFASVGFSREAARSYANMTAVSLDAGFDMPASPKCGAIELAAFIHDAMSEGQ